LRPRVFRTPRRGGDAVRPSWTVPPSPGTADGPGLPMRGERGEPEKDFPDPVGSQENPHRFRLPVPRDGTGTWGFEPQSEAPKASSLVR